ncbi:hypothetical protein TSUD_414000 [Trifolium subterraneum]|uniref:Uncharacterized protein n=1 Tax=Trifolium subterraneum TaxID=3900 RepID=A0A2Z6P6Y7_TRISU|nr:hypothetical protein TSUD_414000 [Trifolium subterraneum]
MISTSTQNDALQDGGDDEGRSFFEWKMDRKSFITWWKERKHCRNMILKNLSPDLRISMCPPAIMSMARERDDGDLAKEGNLAATRDGVQDRVTQAKKQTKKTAEVVDKWLKDANNVMVDVDQKPVYEELMCALEDDDVNMIGLYGMGGCGKTMLAMEMLDFEAIGIPSSEHHKGCKVLISSRSEAVCTLMDCQKKIHLSTLTNDETWDLFQKQALISEGASITVKNMARDISNECKGLPVAIVAVASSLKGKAEVEWKVALDRLRSSKPVNIEKGLQNPYKCLQLSYDNLDTEEAKSLFLLCSVFPEDCEIHVELLTRSAIGLGIVGEVHSYEAARDEVSVAKNKLIRSFGLPSLLRLTLISCLMLGSLFTASTAKTLTSLEELTIQDCHGLKQLVTYGRTQQNRRGEIVQDDHHDFQSYVSIFQSLKRISIMRCHLLKCILPVSFARKLVKLEAIEITDTPELRFVFGHSSHQYPTKFKIELPALEKVALYGIPNMIAICPENYHATCSSLQLLVMNDVGLSMNNLMVDSGATHSDLSSNKTDEGETSMHIEKKLISVFIENGSEIEGIFQMKGSPSENGQQVMSWLEDLKLNNLPKLMYIWMGAKQHCILVLEQCEELEQIIEDDDKENENVPNPQVCFPQLKFLLVTHCNKLNHLLYIHTSHEFPELEYLALNQNSSLVQVFNIGSGVREGTVEVLLPKLKHVILMELPNLNNICQGIEFQTLTNLLVHNCPKFSLTSTTTNEDMLQTCDSGY